MEDTSKTLPYTSEPLDVPLKYPILSSIYAEHAAKYSLL